VKSVTVGKPEQSFFQIALDDLGIAAEEAVMIGDDVRDDVGGAQGVGIKGCLVSDDH
jgi:HAD superfamily hydrolase (TIGR01509 family)